MLLNHNHAPPTEDGRIVEKWSFRRSNYFEHVGEECRNVMDNVGLQDMSAFAKMEVSGPGARAWLDSILANRIPKKQGRIALCHLLTRHGGVRSEFTVYEWAPGRFYLVSAGAYERHDHDMLCKLLPTDGSVNLQPITQMYGVLVLAGPNSRKVLQKLTRADLVQRGFPVAFGQGDLRRHRDRACAARQFRRRTGLGAPSSDRAAERAVRRCSWRRARSSASSPSASGP